jgi:hypothetical protein
VLFRSLSGIAMDNVNVHYNSTRPAQLNALAFAQGSDIHVAPGQEQHLPHEAWHVVQQAQGRVKTTMQMAGVAVNHDGRLEAEADVMGRKAVAVGGKVAQCIGGGGYVEKTRLDFLLSGSVRLAPKPAGLGHGAPIQALFDNLRYPNRKMGVEVTEGTAGDNRLHAAEPNGAFGGVANKAALWPGTVNLPDYTGAGQAWRVAPWATMGALYFDFQISKHNWMRWGDVSMTEDHGEYEWITHHPAAPQNMGYYRDQLNQVNQSRQRMRAALGAFGADLVVAATPDPAQGQAFRIRMGATGSASAQITFESTDAATTKRALYEGVSHGLNKRTRPTQTVLADVTPDIVEAARTSAARLALGGVDKELMMAYLYGDLIHKMAILVSGANWAGVLAGNAKGWRNLFPKSIPYQVTMQAFGRAPNAGELEILKLMK